VKAVGELVRARSGPWSRGGIYTDKVGVLCKGISLRVETHGPVI
jgi:hypothetical protein